MFQCRVHPIRLLLSDASAATQDRNYSTVRGKVKGGAGVNNWGVNISGVIIWGVVNGLPGVVAHEVCGHGAKGAVPQHPRTAGSDLRSQHRQPLRRGTARVIKCHGQYAVLGRMWGVHDLSPGEGGFFWVTTGTTARRRPSLTLTSGALYVPGLH